MDFSGSTTAMDATQTSGGSAPPARAKSKRRYLRPRIDKRNRTGRRIEELKKLYAASLGDRRLTPMLRDQIAQAAEVMAIAEEARAAWLRGSGDRLDAVVTVERHAASLVAGLRLLDAPPATLPKPWEILQAAHLAAVAADGEDE